MGELGARTILAPILWRQGKQVRRTTPRLPEAAAPARESPVAVRPCDCSFLDLAKRADSCAAQTLPAELTSFGFHGWFRLATLATSRVITQGGGHRMVTSELRRPVQSEDSCAVASAPIVSTPASIRRSQP